MAKSRNKILTVMVYRTEQWRQRFPNIGGDVSILSEYCFRGGRRMRAAGRLQ